MKRTIQMTVLSVVAAGAFLVLPGCQNRVAYDDRDVDRDRAVVGQPVPASATFDNAYVASRDTVWASNPTVPGGERGTIDRGTRAYFDQAPGNADWQQARIDGRGIVFVRPVDFAPAGTQ